ncbi:hypothetical protein D9M73_43370 [compost metagenome]
MDFQHRLALNVAQAFDIDKAGVQEVTGGGRDHRQRELCGCAQGFVIGQMVGQAIQALRGKPFAEKFAFA